MTQFQSMQHVAATKTCVGAVNLRVSLWMKSLSVTIEKKTTKHYFPMVLFNVLLGCEQSLFCSKIRAGWTAKSRGRYSSGAASSVGGRVSSLFRPRYSRLVARGSRLEYRTRFLAAPPAGILEQKRDCSQSNVLYKVVLTFEFVVEFPKCGHSIRNYCAVLFWGGSVLLLLVSLCCFCLSFSTQWNFWKLRYFVVWKFFSSIL